MVELIKPVDLCAQVLTLRCGNIAEELTRLAEDYEQFVANGSTIARATEQASNRAEICRFVANRSDDRDIVDVKHAVTLNEMVDNFALRVRGKFSELSMRDQNDLVAPIERFIENIQTRA